MTNEQYYDCIQPYQNACQIMRAKLEVLNGSLYQKSSVSPIHNIQERIKAKKASRRSLKSWGIRTVCRTPRIISGILRGSV